MSPKISSLQLEEKKEVVLDAAYACFSHKGYAGTSIDDIAAEANSSKGAIYNYFPSKDDIFLNLMQRKCQKAYLELLYQFGHLDTANMKLRYLINSDFPINVLDWRWQRVKMEFILCAAEKQDFSLFWQAETKRMRDIIFTIYEDGKKTGEIKKTVDSENMAFLFWSLRDGMHLQIQAGINQEAYKKAQRAMEEFFINKSFLHPQKIKSNE